jgi:hypothetical protein
MRRERFRVEIFHALWGLFLCSLITPANICGRADTIVGQPWLGAAGVVETMDQITARDKANKDHARHVKRALVPEPWQESGSPRSEQAVLNQEANGHGGSNTRTVSSVNFTAATTPDCSGFPPDTMGAVGPSQFIVALNGRVRSFNKTTGSSDGGINVTTDSFFSSVLTPGGNNFSSDPRIRYDRLSGRWFISMIDVPTGQPNRIMLAMSSSGGIQNTSTWTFFQFRHDLVGPTPNADTGFFADYPTLAIDANALYIGVNVFTSSTGGFQNTTLYVIRKSSLLAGGPIAVTAFRSLITAGSGIFTPHGADNFDPTATEGYVTGIDRSDTSILRLLRVATPGGTPAITDYLSVPINSYAPAILVPHQGNTGGTNGYLDKVDQRLMAAHYRNGLLWTCHNVGVNNTGGVTTVTRDGVQWFAITNIPTGSTPAVSQSGIIYQSSSTNATTNRFYWMGTIMVSGQGHVAMGFSSAASIEFINAATTGRLASDPPGFMQTPFLYTRSLFAYNPPGDGGGPRGRRWGDYSFTSVDPSDDMTMWTIQEFCSSTGVYGVRAAKLLAPPPALPTNCVPATVSQGASNVTVVITATSSTNGAAFFEPGAGFTKHLGLAFSGTGITVSSVVSNDPTTITAVLTVAGNAQAGARTISAINPDGQSATSTNALVTILPGPVNNPPSLSPLLSYTLTVGTTLAFTNTATDPDSPPEMLAFSMAPGAPSTAVVDPATGAFTWTPDAAQLGTNTVGVVVTDNGSPPLSATQTFTAIVVLTNHPPIPNPVPEQTTAVGLTLSVTNTATDPDSPPSTLTFSLDAGAPINASINPTNGIFTWPPFGAQVGTNMMGIIVTDNGLPPLSATQQLTVVVLPPNNPPSLTAIANRTIHQGTTLLITNTATDPDVPPQTLTFSLTTAPTGAAIDGASGVFSWTPGPGLVNTTNTISVHVTDNGLPPLSDTKSFLATVLARPLILSAGLSNSVATLSWSAISGQGYRLQSKLSVSDTNWNDLAPDIIAAGPTATGTDSNATNALQFYRVRVLP